MQDYEFRQAVNAALAYGRGQDGSGTQQHLGVSVHALMDLFHEALEQNPREAGLWVREVVHRALVTGDVWRAERMLLAMAWLPASAVAGWGHAAAHEARSSTSLAVRAAATRCLLRWRDEPSRRILRRAYEPDLRLAREIRELLGR